MAMGRDRSSRNASYRSCVQSWVGVHWDSDGPVNAAGIEWDVGI